MTSTREVLKSLVAGTPGVLAAGLLGLDGSTIDILKLDATFPVETVNQEVATLTKLFIYMIQKLQGSVLDDFMMTCDRFTILAALLRPDCCVTLFLSGKGNVGKARVQLRRYLPELATSSEAAG
jgi:predicted regulator of Ras-like GTPase activity (Roadblock/LC7/MglB family)